MRTVEERLFETNKLKSVWDFFLIRCVAEDAGKEVAVCCKERGQAAQSVGVVDVQRMQSALFYAKLRKKKKTDPKLTWGYVFFFEAHPTYHH